MSGGDDDLYRERGERREQQIKKQFSQEDRSKNRERTVQYIEKRN
jgi:hypothetical protein